MGLPEGCPALEFGTLKGRKDILVVEEPRLRLRFFSESLPAGSSDVHSLIVELLELCML